MYNNPLEVFLGKDFSLSEKLFKSDTFDVFSRSDRLYECEALVTSFPFSFVGNSTTFNFKLSFFDEERTLVETMRSKSCRVFIVEKGKTLIFKAE